MMKNIDLNEAIKVATKSLKHADGWLREINNGLCYPSDRNHEPIDGIIRMDEPVDLKLRKDTLKRIGTAIADLQVAYKMACGDVIDIA